MDMTKFASDQDPDYRNVLSELQRFTRHVPHQPEEASRSASSEFSESGGKHYNGTHQGQSAKEHDRFIFHGDSNSTQLTRSVNTFSGTFNSGGGKMFSGSQFDSKGGPMNF